MTQYNNLHGILTFIDANIWTLLFIFVLLIIFIYMRYFGPILVHYVFVSPGAHKPTRAYARSACLDLYVDENCETKSIPAGQWRMIPTGVAFAAWPHIYIKKLNLTITPFGNVAGKIHSRSGLASKRGIRAHLGIIDNDWRGEWSVLIFNHGDYPLRIHPGDKIGQIEFYRVPHVILKQSKKLGESRRGSQGFGSSGFRKHENILEVNKHA
jgi:dUTP pyrophosphatase